MAGAREYRLDSTEQPVDDGLIRHCGWGGMMKSTCVADEGDEVLEVFWRCAGIEMDDV